MKKICLLVTIVIVLTGCGREVNNQTQEIVTTENVAKKESTTTVIDVDISPKLANYDGSIYDGTPIIDWKQYMPVNCELTSTRFWLLSIENKESYIAKDGFWYSPCTEVAKISNDTSDVWTDENGEVGFSFQSGSLHCKLICDNANRYYILTTDWSGFSTCKLGEKNVEIQACYTGIPLADIAELTGYPESTLVSMLKDGTILETSDFSDLFQQIQDCVFDWNNFCEDIWEYAENSDALLPEEYVSTALEKANAQKEEELAQLQQEQEEYEAEMREIGAFKIETKRTVIETESELSEEELYQYSTKGKLDDFGLQIKYLDDNCERFEYVPGYALTKYFLEDGTPLDYTLVDENSDSTQKIKDAGGLDMGVRLVAPNDTSYCLCGFNVSTESNYASVWVMEENQYIEYLKKKNE